jgi:hypothetical protein
VWIYLHYFLLCFEIFYRLPDDGRYRIVKIKKFGCCVRPEKGIFLDFSTCFLPDYRLWRGSGYFPSQTIPRTIPQFLNRSHTSYLLAHVSGTGYSETLAFRLQTPGNNPEENVYVCSIESRT